MKKITVFMLIGLAGLLTHCKNSGAASVAERITGNWVISLVKEASTVVYQTGGSANVRPGYAAFTITLSADGTVVLVDFDGVRFTGKWEVKNDNELVLSGLDPQPTGTGGTITYKIDELTDGSLTLTRTSGSTKTGGTINNYLLTKK